MMRQWLLPLTAMLLLAATPQSPWPQTPAATVARQWVAAFPSEGAMRAFLLRNVDEEGFRQRSLEDRLETYRQSKKKFGSFRLVSIVSSRAEELKASLASADGEKHEFTFTVRSAPPHKLVSITRVETRHHGFGWLPGHH